MLFTNFFFVVAVAMLSGNVLGDHSIVKRAAPSSTYLCPIIKGSQFIALGILLSNRAVLTIGTTIADIADPLTLTIECGSVKYSVATLIYADESSVGNLVIIQLVGTIDFVANPDAWPCTLAPPGYSMTSDRAYSCQTLEPDNGLAVLLLSLVTLLDSVLGLVATLLFGPGCSTNGSGISCVETTNKIIGAALVDNALGYVVAIQLEPSSPANVAPFANIFSNAFRTFVLSN